MKFVRLSLLLAAASLVGCAAIDPRDAPWDPKISHGRTLFDQMPPWDDAAERDCCGHLRVCKPGQSNRC